MKITVCYLSKQILQQFDHIQQGLSDSLMIICLLDSHCHQYWSYMYEKIVNDILEPFMAIEQIVSLYINASCLRVG